MTSAVVLGLTVHSANADPLGPLFPQTPVMADYDRNGRLDIAVVGANFGNSELGVFRNVG